LLYSTQIFHNIHSFITVSVCQQASLLLEMSYKDSTENIRQILIPKPYIHCTENIFLLSLEFLKSATLLGMPADAADTGRAYTDKP
jgi:hypothetical protein